MHVIPSLEFDTAPSIGRVSAYALLAVCRPKAYSGSIAWAVGRLAPPWGLHLIVA